MYKTVRRKLPLNSLFETRLATEGDVLAADELATARALGAAAGLVPVRLRKQAAVTAETNSIQCVFDSR